VQRRRVGEAGDGMGWVSKGEGVRRDMELDM